MSHIQSKRLWIHHFILGTVAFKTGGTIVTTQNFRGLRPQVIGHDYKGKPLNQGSIKTTRATINDDDE